MPATYEEGAGFTVEIWVVPGPSARSPFGYAWYVLDTEPGRADNGHPWPWDDAVIGRGRTSNTAAARIAASRAIARHAASSQEAA